MDFSELLLLLHHEVQKCYDYVDDASRNENGQVPVLHISMEKVEIELPLSLSETSVKHTKAAFSKMPLQLQQFKQPFDARYYGKRLKGFEEEKIKNVSGKSLSATVLNATDKLNENLLPEFMGKIKVTLKPIIK